MDHGKGKNKSEILFRLFLFVKRECARTGRIHFLRGTEILAF